MRREVVMAEKTARAKTCWGRWAAAAWRRSKEKEPADVERRLGTEVGWGKVVGEEKAGREVTQKKMEEAWSREMEVEVAHECVARRVGWRMWSVSRAGRESAKPPR